MVKGNRTSTGATSTARRQTNQPQQPQAAQTTVAQGGGAQAAQPAPQQPQVQNPLQNQIQHTPQGIPILQGGLAAIASLDDDGLAQLMKASKTADMPDQLNDATGSKNMSQAFVYQAGLNEKPQVMDDATFDAYVKQNGLQNQVLRRDVNPISYTVGTTKYNYSADEIAQQFNGGMYNYVGGKHGGSAYGFGTYFEQGRHNTRTGYGNGSRARTMQCVLNPKTARVITERTLYNKGRAFAQSHPKFAKQAGSINSSNQSIYALAMGYNVIDSGDSSRYYVVIDRSAVIARKNAF